MIRRTGLRRRVVAAAASGVFALLVPAIAMAHPLGNFTINHFAAIRVAPDRISLDVVIDRAEIPAFQETQLLDRDADGALSAAELDAARVPACEQLAAQLVLSVDGAPVRSVVTSAGLSTPPGAGGLSTMRLVCEYEAALAAPLRDGASISFEDRSFAERIGWREIVVVRDGVDGTGASSRLTAYPKDLLAQPLDQRSTAFAVGPGTFSSGAWTAPDAQPVAADGGTPVAARAGDSGAGRPSVVAVGAVPGGVAENLAGLIDVQDLTPLAILASLLVAFGLGVVHAVSPGHGKTIMAAYLVGARGSSRQAIVLGLAVTVSHTLGVLALALITLAASSILPPERLYPILGVASGALVIAIGTSLLWTRLRAVAAGRRQRTQPPQFHWSPAHGASHPHEHGHGHDHGHGHGHGHDHGHGHAPVDPNAGISRRGLIALGLSGGLVPSASALILLLGSIAAGRVAYGLVLVLGFGLGMAVVLAGIGLVIVRAKSLVDRRPSIDGLRRFTAPIQLATASLVLVLGIVLTGQALTQVL
jgi:ABC-type nickel/cobalt efflux system permease component RcnA